MERTTAWAELRLAALGVNDDVLRHLDGAAISGYPGAPATDDARGVVEGLPGSDRDTLANANDTADNIAPHCANARAGFGW